MKWHPSKLAVCTFQNLWLNFINWTKKTPKFLIYGTRERVFQLWLITQLHTKGYVKMMAVKLNSFFFLDYYLVTNFRVTHNLFSGLQQHHNFSYKCIMVYFHTFRYTLSTKQDIMKIECESAGVFDSSWNVLIGWTIVTVWWFVLGKICLLMEMVFGRGMRIRVP